MAGIVSFGPNSSNRPITVNQQTVEGGGDTSGLVPYTGATGDVDLGSNDLSVEDEAYGAGWNGSLEVPTKNAVYDKVEALVTGVSSVSAANASLTVSPTTGAVLASLNLGNANTWTALQTKRLTTKQDQWEYDASNYANITVGSTGTVTFDAVGSGAKFSFSDSVGVGVGQTDGGTGAKLYVSTGIYTPGWVWATSGLYLTAANQITISPDLSTAVRLTGSGGLQFITSGGFLQYDGATGFKVYQNNLTTYGSMRVGTLYGNYDGSNYYSATVGSTGGVTFDAVGSGASFTFSDNVTAPNLILTAGSGGTTDGQTWNDSTQKAIASYAAGVKQFHDTTLFSQTSSVTVANTTTETAVLGSGVGTLTLPANFFVAGKTIRLTVWGYHSSASNPNLRFRVKLGSTTVLDSGAVASKNSSNDALKIVCDITCRTTGVSGTVMGQGTVTEAGNPATILNLVSTAAVTVDTTAAAAVGVTAEWGTASASNTLTITNASVEVLA